MEDQEDPPVFREIGLVYDGDGYSSASMRQAEIVRKQLSTAARLTDFTDEYEFYTPALLHTRIPLGNQDPYHDFLNEVNCEVPRISLCFESPIFRGLEVDSDPAWNHVLYGMPKLWWKQFSQFMGSLAFHDRDANTLTRIRTQDLYIVDPLYLKKLITLPDDKNTLPRVPITTFCLDKNVGCVYFKIDDSPLSLPRVVVSGTPYEDTVIFHQELSQDKETPNPYGVIEQRETQSQGKDVRQSELEERLREFHEKEKHNETGTDSAGGGT